MLTILIYVEKPATEKVLEGCFWQVESHQNETKQIKMFLLKQMNHNILVKNRRTMAFATKLSGWCLFEKKFCQSCCPLKLLSAGGWGYLGSSAS